MKKNKLNIEAWLSFSLFYNPANFSTLIANGIKPLVDELMASGNLMSYFYSPSTNRGHNIILRLKGYKHILDKIIKPKVEVHFKTFFLQNPSEELPYELPIASLFLPFPNNSLQFNQYYQDILNLGGFEGALIAEELFFRTSAIAADRIKAHPNRSIEKTISETMHLHFMGFQAFDLSPDEAFYFSKIYMEYLLPRYLPHTDPKGPEGIRYHNYRKQLQTLFADRFKMQKERFSAYFSNYMSMLREGLEHDENWMNQWNAFFRKANTDLIALQKTDKFLRRDYFKPNKKVAIEIDKQERILIYAYYFHQINSQLGILGIEEMYMHYMIHEILTTMKNGK